MNRIIVFQYEDVSLSFIGIGEKIRDALISSLIRYGYHILPDDLHDPDWPVHVQKEEREFVVILVNQYPSPSYWDISVEDLNHNLLDDVELQEQINPILSEVVNNLSNAVNIIWHEDFEFLKK